MPTYKASDQKVVYDFATVAPGSTWLSKPLTFTANLVLVAGTRTSAFHFTLLP